MTRCFENKKVYNSIHNLSCSLTEYYISLQMSSCKNEEPYVFIKPLQPFPFVLQCIMSGIIEYFLFLTESH